jgi:hypothetical protein
MNDALGTHSEEDVEKMIEDRLGVSDVKTSIIASSVIDALGLAAYSSKVTPDEILKVAEKLSQNEKLERLIALSSFGVEARDKNFQKAAFWNNKKSEISSENSLLHSLGKLVSEKVLKSQDAVDGLHAVIAEKDSTGKSIFRVASSYTNHQEENNSKSRMEELRRFAQASGVIIPEPCKEDLRVSLFALASYADKYGIDKAIDEIKDKDAEQFYILMTENVKTAGIGNEDNLMSWVKRFAQNTNHPIENVAAGLEKFASRNIAVRGLLEKIVESAKLSQEKTNIKRITATVSELSGIGVNDDDFEIKFQNWAMNVFRDNGYNVDPSDFNCVDIDVNNDLITATFESRFYKSVDLDASKVQQSNNFNAIPVDTQMSPAPEPELNIPTLYTSAAWDKAQREAQMAPGMAMPAPATPGVTPGQMPDPMMDPMALGINPQETGMQAPTEENAGEEALPNEDAADTMPEPGVVKPWGTICPRCGSSNLKISGGE